MDSNLPPSQDVTFLADESGRTPIKDRVNKPTIGIWWDDGIRIVAVLQQPGDFTDQSILQDSHLSHADEWALIAQYFGKSSDDDYFLIPRGRVLFNNRENLGIIYHGNVTSQYRLGDIADRFGLKVWKAQLDDHYLMGDAADRLFDEEN